MKVIGITGGAGSGKSFICQIISEEFDFPVIDSDRVAKSLMRKGSKVFKEVVEKFGEEILTEDGDIDRSKLASIVFNDKEKLLMLNSIVHPATIKAICNKLNDYHLRGKKYVFVESAIALESGYASFCDEFWYVFATDEARRQRLKETRGFTDEKIDSIFSSQNTSGEIVSRCAHIIKNPPGVAKEYIVSLINKYL